MLSKICNTPIKKIFIGVLLFHIFAMIWLSCALKTRPHLVPTTKMAVRSIQVTHQTPTSPTVSPTKKAAAQNTMQTKESYPKETKRRTPAPKSVNKESSSPRRKKAAATATPKKIDPESVGKANSIAQDLSIPKPISFLSIENSNISHTRSQEQMNYSALLVQFLEDRLVLPEKGEVKLQLFLNKEGKVLSVDILKAESVKNREYLKNTLPQLSFPCFNTSVSEMQCSYTIRFLSQK